MLDIQFIRDNHELIRYAADRRGVSLDVQPLLTVDDERRKIAASLQAKKARMRLFEKMVAQGDQNAAATLSTIASEITQEEGEYARVLQQFKREMLAVPNLPDISVPTGTEEEKAVLIHSADTLMSSPKETYSAVCEKYGITFQTRHSVQVPQYTHDAYILLDTLQHALTRAVASNGYEWILTPSGVSRNACIASGMDAATALTQPESEEYTGESTTPYLFQHYSSQEIAEPQLPQHHAILVPLERGDRRESCIGFLSFGLPRHDVSVELHESLRALHEKMLEALKIPYRVSVMTARHAPTASVKSYVIELMCFKTPLFFTTVSYYHDYQTRRGGVSTLDATGKRRFVHSVASDGLSLTTLLVALRAAHGTAAGAHLESLSSII